MHTAVTAVATNKPKRISWKQEGCHAKTKHIVPIFAIMKESMLDTKRSGILDRCPQDSHCFEMDTKSASRDKSICWFMASLSKRADKPTSALPNVRASMTLRYHNHVLRPVSLK